MFPEAFRKVFFPEKNHCFRRLAGKFLRRSILEILPEPPAFPEIVHLCRRSCFFLSGGGVVETSVHWVS